MGSSRLPWAVGLTISIAIVITGSAFAYAGALPIWLAPHNVDKVLHFAMAAALAFFTDGVLARRTLIAGRIHLPLATVVVLVPVGLEEYLQRLSEVRSSSIWDFTADVLGVAAGTLASRAVARRLRGKCEA